MEFDKKIFDGNDFLSQFKKERGRLDKFLYIYIFSPFYKCFH